MKEKQKRRLEKETPAQPEGHCVSIVQIGKLRLGIVSSLPKITGWLSRGVNPYLFDSRVGAIVP